MEDIREAALATLAPPPDRRGEFDALFRAFFYGEATVAVDGESDEETAIKDDGGVEREASSRELARRKSGESASGARAARRPRISSRPTMALAAFRRALPAALPHAPLVPHGAHARRAASSISAARCARSSRADGDVPSPLLRRRQTVPRRLLILIDISGSMKLHTERLSASSRMRSCRLPTAPRSSPSARG